MPKSKKIKAKGYIDSIFSTPSYSFRIEFKNGTFETNTEYKHKKDAKRAMKNIVKQLNLDLVEIVEY